MIKIEKPREKNCYCRCCQSADNVLEVEFNSETGGTHVALCERCREELADKVIECDRKKTERERWEQEQKEDEEICKSCTKVDCSGCGICSDRKDGRYQ